MLTSTIYFRGNPDKCDYLGNSSLHLAAANGHMNCVTYLVSLGCNLWSLDNDFHTPLDVAGLNDRTEIVRYLDRVYSIQSERNRKLVKRFKEKAVVAAQKRIKKYNKLQAKAQKRADREDKRLAEIREKMVYDESPHSAPASVYSTLKSDRFSRMSFSSSKTAHSEPKPYSAHFTLNSSSSRKLFGGNVAKKIRERRENGTLRSEFKIREFEGNGTETVRPISGLKRDHHILYVNRNRTFGGDGTLSSKSTKSAHLEDDIVLGKDSRKTSDTLSRAISEPDFAAINDDSGIESGDSNPRETPGMFDRPGFGTVAFINKRITSGALMSLPWDNQQDSADEGQTASRKDDEGKGEVAADARKSSTKSKSGKKTSVRRKGSFAESIGTLGSLALRIKDVPWDDSDVDQLEDDDTAESTPLELFLSANGLTEFLSNFTKEKIDLTAAMLLSDGDLKELSLPLGPRRRYLEAVERRKNAVTKPGVIYDTKL